MPSSRGVREITALSDGRVLVAGGVDANSIIASADIYDPGTNSWSAAASMNIGRAYHSAALLPDGSILVAGADRTCTPPAPGCSMSSSSTAEVYDPMANTWMADANMAHGRAFHTATLISGGRVLVAGGAQSGYFAETYQASSVGGIAEAPIPASVRMSDNRSSLGVLAIVGAMFSVLAMVVWRRK